MIVLMALSSAALPFLLEDAKHKLGIRAEMADFILPLEVMLNRDGSAMFISCAAVFTAQANGVLLNVQSYFLIM